MSKVFCFDRLYVLEGGEVLFCFGCLPIVNCSQITQSCLENPGNVSLLFRISQSKGRGEAKDAEHGS